MNQQSLTIFLDKSLTSKFDKSEYESSLKEEGLTEYVSFHKVQQFNENIYKEQTNNGLINAFLLAYNNHLPLKLKPDDIHIALQLIFSTFVNNNAEQLRDLFVDHKDKKELSVEYNKLDFNIFSKLMVEQVKDNVKDSNIINILETNYSTSNQIIKTVSGLLILNTLKEYISYEFILGCGIPSIILVGTQDDWNLLKLKYEQLKKICNTIPNNELVDWFPCMDKIMNMFIDLRMLAINGSVDAPEYYKLLWQRVISFVPQGSGGDTVLGGWVSVLSPYASVNKVKKIFTGLPCLDISNDLPPKEKYGYYQYQDILTKFYGGCGWSTLQTTLLITPAILTEYDGTKYKILIEAGLSLESFINQNNEVEFNYSYDIKKQSNDYINKLNEYKEKGYYVEDDCLKYPIQYHNIKDENGKLDILNVMTFFNVTSSSYY